MHLSLQSLKHLFILPRTPEFRSKQPQITSTAPCPNLQKNRAPKLESSTQLWSFFLSRFLPYKAFNHPSETPQSIACVIPWLQLQAFSENSSPIPSIYEQGLSFLGWKWGGFWVIGGLRLEVRAWESINGVSGSGADRGRWRRRRKMRENGLNMGIYSLGSICEFLKVWGHFVISGMGLKLCLKTEMERVNGSTPGQVFNSGQSPLQVQFWLFWVDFSNLIPIRD